MVANINNSPITTIVTTDNDSKGGSLKSASGTEYFEALKNGENVQLSQSIKEWRAYNITFKNTTSAKKHSALKSLDKQISEVVMGNPDKLAVIHQLCTLLLQLSHAICTRDSVDDKNKIIVEINKLADDNEYLKTQSDGNNSIIHNLLQLTYNQPRMFYFSRSSVPDAILLFCKMVGYDYQQVDSLDVKIKNLISKRSPSDEKLEKRHRKLINNNMPHYQQQQQEITQILRIVIPNENQLLTDEQFSATAENITTVKRRLTELYYTLNQKERKLVSEYLVSIKENKGPETLLPTIATIQPPENEAIRIELALQELHNEVSTITVPNTKGGEDKHTYAEVVAALSLIDTKTHNPQTATDHIRDLFCTIGLDDNQKPYIINPLVLMLLLTVPHPNGQKTQHDTALLTFMFVQSSISDYDKYKDKTDMILEFYRAVITKLAPSANQNKNQLPFLFFTNTRSNGGLRSKIQDMSNDIKSAQTLKNTMPD
jgi:hypothetical protein